MKAKASLDSFRTIAIVQHISCVTLEEPQTLCYALGLSKTNKEARL